MRSRSVCLIAPALADRQPGRTTAHGIEEIAAAGLHRKCARIKIESLPAGLHVWNTEGEGDIMPRVFSVSTGSVVQKGELRSCVIFHSVVMRFTRMFMMDVHNLRELVAAVSAFLTAGSSYQKG